MTDRLDARLVIGGLWKGAVVTMEGAAHGVISGAVAIHRSYNTLCPGWVFGHGSHGYIAVPDGNSRYWTVSLELPGEDGGNAHRLDQRVKARTEGWAEQGRMSDEFYTAMGRAFPAEGWAWLSRYLAMTDALAAKRGWPTGPGAPVYRWEPTMRPGVWDTGHGGDDWVTYHAPPEITDPMAALEAVWKQECAP